MSRAAVFVALTGALAALLALLAALVAARRGLEINIWVTMATALVVGVFMAFLWLGPRDRESRDPEGFAVVARTRTRLVAQTEESDPDEEHAEGSAGPPEQRDEPGPPEQRDEPGPR